MICTNCLNRYYSGVPEDPRHDPNVPDPKKPWCPECEEHTEYESLPCGDNIADYCLNCGTMVFRPTTYIFALCLGMLVFFMLTIGGFLNGGFNVGVLFVVASLLLFLMYYIIYIPRRRRKKAWLAWARERGYTED
jgi:hypothetical protein